MKRNQKIGIGIALAIVVVMAAGFWTVKKAQSVFSPQRFFYPVAPPMPPVVDEPMPEILAHLESVLKTNAPQVLVTLRPGISSNQISRLEQQYNVQVPDDIKAIYEWHDGAPANTNYFADLPNTGPFADLIPGHHFVSLEDMFEENKEAREAGPSLATSRQRAFYRLVAGQRVNWYRLLADCEGDGYFFDPTRKPAEGAIFSTVTEEGYFLFFPSAKNLMAGIAKCYEQGAYRVKQGGPGPAEPVASAKAGASGSPLQLDEDFDQSTKIWKEFGAGNQE